MLANHLPEFMRGIKEISCIMAAEDKELEAVGKAVKSCLDNSFIAFADANGLRRWATLMDLPTSLTEREIRDEVVARLSESLPYTYYNLDAVLTALYGRDGVPQHFLDVDSMSYSVELGIHPRFEEILPVIERLLRRQVPANMTISFLPWHIRHRELKDYTHGFLNTKTYLEIRRRKLDDYD
jgi:hypothetical protein